MDSRPNDNKLKKVTKDIFKLGDFEKALAFVSACIVIALYFSHRATKNPLDSSVVKPVIQQYESEGRDLKHANRKTEALAISSVAVESDDNEEEGSEVVQEKVLTVSDHEAIVLCLGDEGEEVKSLSSLYEVLGSKEHQEVIVASAHHLESADNRFWYKIEKVLTANNLYRMLIAEPNENDEVGFPQSLTFNDYESAVAYISEVNTDEEVYTEKDMELIFNKGELSRAEVKLIDDEPTDFKIYLNQKQLNCSSLAVDKTCVCL